MITRIQLIVIIIFVSSLTAYTKEIKFEQLGIEEGLSQINIRSLCQDEVGCLWIGTNEGLIRYNGSNFDNIPIFSGDTHIYQSSIQKICGNRQGYLYLKTNLNYVFEYDIRNGTFKQIHQEPGNRQIVLQYGLGRLWIAVQNRIYEYRDGVINLYHSLSDTHAKITAIRQASNKAIYVGTQSSGTWRLEQQRESLVVSTTSEVIDIFEDSNKYIWIGTQSEGLYVVDTKHKIKQFTTESGMNNSLSSNYVRAVCEDDNGIIWIGTIAGLDRLDPENGQITLYGKSTQKEPRLSHPAVQNLLKDDQGNIWIATFYGGLNYFNPNDDIFKFYDFSEVKTMSEYPIISCTVEDRNGNIWVGTEGSGLLCLDSKKQVKKHYKQGKQSISQNIIKLLYYDQDNDMLWIGTHHGGLDCLNLKTNQIEHISINSSDNNISAQSVQTIVPYHSSLYLGTLAGVYRYDKETKEIVAEEKLNIDVSIVQDMLIDQYDNLWIGSNGLYNYNLQTKEVKKYHNIIRYTDASPYTLVNNLFLDSKNYIWLGTAGAGVIRFDPNTNNYLEFNQFNSGLDNNYVSCVYESKSGHILVGTNSGFSFVNEEKHRCFNYKSHNGFPLLSMISGCISGIDGDKLVFGGINGICIFDDRLLLRSRNNTRIRFDKLWVNNKWVVPDDKSGILEKELPFTSKIELNDQQRIFSIYIASDNYIKDNQPNFEYKLIPYDDDWISLKQGDPVSYMNLPPGQYKLIARVEHMLNNQLPNIELDITVTPPVYATWYAYLIYILIFLAISIWIMLFIRSKLLLQASLVFERKDKERRELANQSKLRFFTYVSHEFRTPITLVINQLEIILRSEKKGSILHKETLIAYRNAQKLIHLINELLDFRKQEQGSFQLVVTLGNIVSFIQGIYDSFVSYAESKKINLTFESEKDSIEVYFDQVQIQKVLNNIISNSLKYTSPNGCIDIKINDYPEYVTISVKDTGIGIPKELLDNIFDQFYQVSNDTNKFIAGSGLGLALSKSIIDFHEGKIQINSELECGSEVIVTLLKGRCHFDKKDKVKVVDQIPDLRDNINNYTNTPEWQLIPEEEDFLPKIDKNAPTVLVVEDNDDMRGFLKKILSSMYHVIEATDGYEGYESACKNQPGLIVSDIMMPRMDGNQMCTKLKENFETCHIPIILLTAQSTIEQNIEGLKSGGDDFITKPFNSHILLVRCSNLLNNRRILQEKYSKEIEVQPLGITSNPADQHFIEKAVQIIEENIMNQKINVDFLCSEMAIGRRLFFSKMKSITGQTPNNFILTVKYKVAASMLKKNPEMNISEISDLIGFSSQKYFSKGFKEHFGISPTEMRERLNSSD